MATRKKKNNIGAFGHPIYGKGFAKYGEMRPNGSSEIPNDLEEAAENYIAPIENDEGLDYINFNGRDIKDAFKAGAKWQYQKDREEFAKIKAKTWCEGFDAHKEQMLKDAIHYVVQDDLDPHGASYNVPFIRIGRDALKSKGIGVGDKVCIVVFKAEEE